MTDPTSPEERAEGESEMTTKINTPIDIQPPVPGVTDHGLTLVHEMGGKPRNWLHEVSIEGWDTQGRRLLSSFGYAESHGWIKDGEQMWVYSKAYPLGVAVPK